MVVVVVVFLFILRAKQKNCANFGGAAFAGGANAAKRANGFFVGIRKFDNVKKYYINKIYIYEINKIYGNEKKDPKKEEWIFLTQYILRQLYCRRRRRFLRQLLPRCSLAGESSKKGEKGIKLGPNPNLPLLDTTHHQVRSPPHTQVLPAPHTTPPQ